MHRRIACRGLVALCVLASLSSVVLGQDAPPRKYTVAVDSLLKMTAGAQQSALSVKATAAFDYTLTPKTASQVESSIDGIELVTSINGQAENKTRMSRAGFYNTDGQETRDISYTNAPQNLRAILDQFGAPLATYTLSKEGEQVGTPALKIQSGVLIDTNAYNLARTFHVKFPKDQTKWVVPTSLPLGQGQFSKGDLTFEKQPKVLPDGSVMVKVSGELTVSGKLGQATINQGVYRVKGSQIYQPSLGDWASGQYNIAMEIDANDPRTGQIKGAGPVTLTLKLRK